MRSPMVLQNLGLRTSHKYMGDVARVPQAEDKSGY